MTLIVLALVGLMVLVVTVSPPDQAVRNRTPAATATPNPQTASLSDPDAFDVSETFSATAGAAERTVDAEVGDRVEITVEGSTADSVALGDLAVEGFEAGFPARFELLADTPGTYPLVLLNEERRIGALEVR
jgi:hypothetical protein